jgi:uncharacterized protein
MPELPIGTVKGPGETPHEFTFVAPDPEQRVKYGEFVYYEADVDGQLRRILARVTQRFPLRLYPDAFMADPTIPPRAVAELLGFQAPALSGAQAPDPAPLFQITAMTLGYYDANLGFVNPRVPPRSGAPIYIAPDGLLREVLSRSTPGEVGAVHIGSLLSRAPDAVPIVLDARGFTSTHLAIIASTGAGKSYLAGVIIEELMKANNRAAVLIVDPHAEYDTLTSLQAQSLFEESGYEPRVRIYHPDEIKVRVSSLDIADLRYLLPNLSERMHHYLGRAYGFVKRRYSEKWTKEHLSLAVRSVGVGNKEDGDDGGAAGSGAVTDPDAGEDPTIGALIWRIDSVLGSRIFDNFQNLPLEDLFRPGQCTVLQLNEIPEREQQIIVATLLRRLYQARQNTERHRATQGEEDYLPYPAFVLIEEAHNFAPAAADLVTTQILKQILSEGRKFGVSVGLISQRPGKLDSDVLSQCMTQCIMRIVNPVDQARVAESVESVGRDLLHELPALSKGQVIIAGASVNTPVMVRVRRRETPHGAEDLNAPERWQAYFGAEQAHQRARDDAPPATPPRRSGNPMYKS